MVCSMVNNYTIVTEKLTETNFSLPYTLKVYYTIYFFDMSCMTIVDGIVLYGK